MGRIQWTSEQREIIKARGSNILVSAAAGSGKTAVLIERIYQRIIDKSEPVDVDQFLVVTFTKAAAAQMKDRLRERLEQALSERPEDLHLQRQVQLMGAAHISTVHSFCGYVIQNYFHRIGMDPSYRQGTESELALIRKEVLTELLEEKYEEGDEAFVALADMNMFNHSDEKMEEMLSDIYDKAMSQPFPRHWLEQMLNLYEIQEEEEWERSAVCRCVLEDCRQMASGLEEELEQQLKICGEPDGPYVYEDNVKELLEFCGRLQTAGCYEEFRTLFRELQVSSMSRKKGEGISPEKREEVKERRNRCKTVLTDMRDRYFYQSRKEHLRDLIVMGERISTLLRLAGELMDRFTLAKRERNVIDFNDLEQLALSILLRWDEEKEQYVRSEAALELSEHFAEIMIDEYQDSNHVQDTLLTSVSRDGLPGRNPNLFMVGDVKQSIYRFRNACPELFAEKLETYEMTPGAGNRRIDLHQNFRSREVVLEGANAVFRRMMHRDIGGVEYDAEASLQPGRSFADTGKPVADRIDTYIILDKGDAELEARLAASRIQAMTEGEEPLYIQDGETLRRVKYKDIVILTRSVRAVGQAYFDVLSQCGIPVVMEHSQGFFDTREIQLMTQMLQIIDNPRLDLSLAGVMCGPMYGFTEEELAMLRAGSRRTDLYSSLLVYQEETPSSREGELLQDKTGRFLQILNGLRRKTAYATVAELIQDIYDETGIYESVQMMRDGVQRTANMDLLMEQAREFDASVYHGLHAFVQYINRIREQQEEMGEVNIVGEEENVVRIMTMHKSKGLEFPVCILLGLGRKLGGSRSQFLTIHPELGIASKIVDNETRTVKDNLYRSALIRQNDIDDLGEEMRVLYVAMTRAEEKLILIGCAKETRAVPVNYLGRSQTAGFLDMILPAALNEPEWFHVELVEREGLVEESVRDMALEKIETEALNNFDTSFIYHEELHRYLQEFQDGEAGEPEPLPVKVSVSDLKVKSMEEQDFQDFRILTHEEDETQMPVPSFIKGEQETDAAGQGAAYGTIWHQVMAAIDFARTRSEDEIREAVRELVRKGRLREEDTEVLNYRRLQLFFTSELGCRMREADCCGRLHREQPFVMGKPARDIFPDRTEEDIVLVQGIIDAYFETEDGIVLLDYKTDALRRGEEEKLICRYQEQMRLYGRALEEMMEKPVIECFLYSFSLGKEIPCPAGEAGG
ncbi:MAG: helicase-exonuclease AddAB subunit AddA [Eubacterium sp.]|nr:helicase-exonuclease AddAB subunit AddA [Eubacterium sp.]